MRILLVVSLFLLAGGQGTAQRYTRDFKFRHLGPHRVPPTTSDSGEWCPNGIGWIESLAIHPLDSRILYAGSNSGGLYRSNDAGNTWRFVLNIDPVTGVQDMVLDESNPDELWIGTGTTVNQFPFGYGVLHSVNGGETWESTGLSFLPHDEEVIRAVDRSKMLPGLFVALSNSEIYLSSDTCRTFRKVLSKEAGMERDFRQLLLPELKSGNAFAAGNQIWKSSGPLESWERIDARLSYHNRAKKGRSAPDRYALSRNPLNPRSLIVLYKYDGVNYIDRSSDEGEVWQNMYTGRDFSRVDRNHSEIAYDPTDTNILYVGAVRMYRSVNGGQSFELISHPLKDFANFMHDDIRALEFDAQGNLYTGNDGGVAVSYDKGSTWQDRSGEGLSVTQIYGIAAHPSQKGELLIGCQDLGNFLYRDGWTNFGTIYGDGGECLFANNRMYVMQNGQIRASTQDLKRWEMVPMRFSPNRLHYPLFPGSLETELLVGDDNVLTYANRTWENRSPGLGKHFTKIRALSVHTVADTSYVLLAKDQPTWSVDSGLRERLFRGKFWNGGDAWEDITDHLPILAWRSVSSIVQDEDDPNHFWVSLYGYDDDYGRFKVFESRDNGTSWINYSEGLPNYGTYVMQHNGGKRDGLFLGTDGGVYFRNNQMDEWVKLKGEMPAHMLRDFALQRQYKRLYIATYGNGVWELKLPRYLRK